jgi:hypothetical protein
VPVRTLRLALAGSATLLATVVAAAPTYAAVPDAGHFSGEDGVGVHVGRTAHDSPVVENAHFHHRTAFERVPVHHDGTFRTCMREGRTQTIFKEICISGTFHRPEHATGVVEIYHGAMGHVAQRPYETHHYAVTLNR